MYVQTLIGLWRSVAFSIHRTTYLSTYLCTQ